VYVIVVELIRSEQCVSNRCAISMSVTLRTCSQVIVTRTVRSRLYLFKIPHSYVRFVGSYRLFYTLVKFIGYDTIRHEYVVSIRSWSKSIIWLVVRCVSFVNIDDHCCFYSSWNRRVNMSVSTISMTMRNIDVEIKHRNAHWFVRQWTWARQLIVFNFVKTIRSNSLSINGEHVVWQSFETSSCTCRQATINIDR
jgi:hypothetical protein